MKSELAISRMEGRRRRPRYGCARGAALSLLVCLGMGGAYAQQHGHPAPPPRQEHAAPATKPPAGHPAESPRPAGNVGQQNFGQRPAGDIQEMPHRSLPGMYAGARPGQEHLPQWLNQHQNLTPAQQEQALRREPGFNRLAPEQQQRVLNRLRSLDLRPPQVRQRMLARNEAFERLTPEGRQEVRAAAQALNQMPPGRQQMVRRAFHDLRGVPPEQRQSVLNSARFSHEYSPQERHVLGNLLSIEPYEPR